MKKRRQVVKVALTRLRHSKITQWNEKQKYLPTLSKSYLHNYFADKMAVFSVIVGYIVRKAKQSLLGPPDASNRFDSLYVKLEEMRFDFLDQYHQLNFNSREVIKDESERIKALFDSIYQFERRVVSEILRTGIPGEELQKLNKSPFLLV